MSTYTTATDRTLTVLNDFLTEWIPPAALPLVCGHHGAGDEPLRRAIIALGNTTPGWLGIADRLDEYAGALRDGP